MFYMIWQRFSRRFETLYHILPNYASVSGWLIIVGIVILDFSSETREPCMSKYFPMVNFTTSMLVS